MKEENKKEEKNSIEKDTKTPEQENKKEEKKDCIIDPKQHELDELNDRYKRVLAEL